MTQVLESRGEAWRRLGSETFDLLVIGGGITGAGIALDAASRGMKTVLVEMQDFAAGTSSRSTKLVHGGLRYLKQFEVGLVAEVGRERAIVYGNGPHVTTPERMMLPIYRGGTFGKLSTSIGLMAYDFLAAVKRGERRRMLRAEETLRREPLLKREKLLGSGYYVEYRTDDARLTLEVMKRAVEEGAVALNYAAVERLLYDDDGRLVGAAVGDRLANGAAGSRERLTEDAMNGPSRLSEELVKERSRLPGSGTVEVRAAVVVNATGPWVDRLRELDGSRQGKQLRLTKGIHLVFDGERFPLRQAIYFDTPDKRMIFAIPRDGKTYVGTTDTFYEDDPAAPVMTEPERDYLLAAVNDMFPKLRLGAADAESSWAGVRPLIYEEGKNPSEISRKDEVWQSPSGLVTIAGGKLTGYRKMAETVVDLVARKLRETGSGSGREEERDHGSERRRVFPASRTKALPISGGDVGGADAFSAYVERQAAEAARYGLTEEQGRRLARTYGSNVSRLFAIAGDEKHRAAAERYGLPIEWYAAVVYAVEGEMALKPVDVLIRRTGALLFRIDLVRRYGSQVVALMREMFGWSEDMARKYAYELEAELRNAVTPRE